jgi:DNA adenine methylase
MNQPDLPAFNPKLPPQHEPPLRPPLKWAGGKRWLVPHLLPLWRAFRERAPGAGYAEPFAGGLATALGLQPQSARLNDMNPHLIGFYKQLQRGLVIDAALDFRNDRDLYYAQRDAFNRLIADDKSDTPTAAALFYYLNRTGYNGLCRFNRSGQFNVPFGKYKTITYQRDFSAYREVMRGWTFSSGDFEAFPLQPGEFVYADPPYDVEFVSYAKEGFSWDDQRRLAAYLARHDGVVVLSNQATPRIVELYQAHGFELCFLDAPRRISSDGNRTPAKEVLAVKNEFERYSQ